MYCPNCDKEYEGKFCPECGTKLIEKPATSAGVVNLGDANAISGGLHVNDSHNVHNEDKSVHNISNVSNVTHNVTQVAAQKTEMELLQEKKALYLNECKRAYEDNVLEHSEIVALEEYRIKIGLDKATADSILDSVRVMTERNARKTSLNPIAKIKLKLLTDNLQKNEVKALMDQIDSLEALVNKFEHDELSRKYFLVLAALKPEKCISLKENSKIDSYWKSFWSYLAYIKAGRTAEAENVLMSMDRFADYPEDNMTILAIAGALINGSKEEAKAYLESITGDYTPALQRFVDSIYLLIESDMATEMGADEDTCAFYLVNFFGVQKDSKDGENDYIGNCIWDDTKDFSEGLAAVSDGQYWGFINSRMELVIPCEYDTVRAFREGICGVQKEGYYGFIDSRGKCLTDFEYDDISAFHEGLCGVKQDGKWGFIDRKGNQTIPCQYNDVKIFSEGLAAVQRDHKWGFIDKTGNQVIWPLYDEDPLWFSEGLVCVCYHGKYGYIDHKGKEIIEFLYDYAFDFCEGLALVESNELYGFIDKQGKVVVPFKYDFGDISEFSEGMARIKSNGLYGYLDSNGTEIIPCKYEQANDFKDGYACVKINGCYGFIDKTGKVVISLKYDMANSFSEGLALVEIDGYYGFIDRKGEEVIPCKYDRAWSFHEKMARITVETEDGWKKGFIPVPTTPCVTSSEPKE